MGDKLLFEKTAAQEFAAADMKQQAYHLILDFSRDVDACCTHYADPTTNPHKVCFLCDIPLKIESLLSWHQKHCKYFPSAFLENVTSPPDNESILIVADRNYVKLTGASNELSSSNKSAISKLHNALKKLNNPPSKKEQEILESVFLEMEVLTRYQSIDVNIGIVKELNSYTIVYLNWEKFDLQKLGAICKNFKITAGIQKELSADTQMPITSLKFFVPFQTGKSKKRTAWLF